ncbi:hypothetical protein [Inquilinus sp. CAU 1745]|uniref:hypothetical protein n=1 Tax=Inquilinus sp. CAU 1745 TaxID=3140369 RepID=UPI00325AAD90
MSPEPQPPVPESLASRPRRPPRLLVAASITLGFVFIYLTAQDFASRGPLADAPREALFRLGLAILAFNLGYIVAPLALGRGPWLTFLGALILGPTVIGWLLMFWPGMLFSPVLAFLGVAAAGILLALYFYVFWYFVTEFMGNRTPGG